MRYEIDGDILASMADKCRVKNNNSKLYTPVEMIDEIIPHLQSKTATQNGTVTPDSGYDGLSSVVVDVQGSSSDIEVIPLSVTENNTYTAPAGKAYSPVTVSVSGGEQLPSDYQQVEYLLTGATIGAVYLPAIIQAGDIISMDVSADNWKARQYMAFGGIKKSFSNTTDPRAEFFTLNGIRRIFISTGTIHNADDPTVTVTNGTISYGNELSNNERIMMNIAFDSALSDSYVYFGAYSSSEYMINAKLFSLSIKDANQRTVVNLIPCRRKSDSVPGFYDMRTNRFMTAFTGSFTAGPDVN